MAWRLPGLRRLGAASGAPRRAADALAASPHDYEAQVDRNFLDHLQRFLAGEPLTRLAIRNA